MKQELGPSEALFSRGKALNFLAASHEEAKNPGALKKVLFGSDSLPSGKIQMVNWAKLPAQKSFRCHYHEDMYEIFIIMAGKAEMKVGPSTFNLEAGDALIVPPTAIHSMTALDDKDVDYIVFGVSSGCGGKTVVV